MIIQDNEDFAWWIVEKLVDEGILSLDPKLNHVYHAEVIIKAEIRRILMENEKEKGGDAE